MEKRMKNTESIIKIISRTLIWLTVICVIGGVAVVGLWVKEKSFTPNATIAVSGECLTSAPKDRTAITLRVRSLDKSAATSMKIASTQMNEITTYLKTLDVQMQTTRFDSYERSEWNQTLQKSEMLGIETNLAVEVSAKSMDTIEKILENFAGNENVFTENLHMFTATETLKPIMEKCLGTAVENARVRASQIANRDDREIGKLISATYGTASAAPIAPTNFLRSAKMEVMRDTAYADGGLVSKDTDVSVSVSAIFEIK
jgi:uncharacterized protein YggE